MLNIFFFNFYRYFNYIYSWLVRKWTNLRLNLHASDIDMWDILHHTRACVSCKNFADSKKLSYTSVERYFSVYIEICLQLVLGRNVVVALYELLRECWWLSAHIQHLAMLTNIYSSTYTRVPIHLHPKTMHIVYYSTVKWLIEIK